MLLQGAIDAAVNGGISKYLKAFLASDYLTQHPDHAHWITMLKQHLMELVRGERVPASNTCCVRDTC